MISRRKKIFLLIICFLLILPAFSVYADEPPLPPYPYTIQLNDDLVFYMTPPGQESSEYRKSGLYQNDNLVYPVNEYIRDGIVLANDGMTFLVIPWWVSSPDAAAVVFYNRGEIMHSFSAIDLMKDQSRMSKSVSHYQWDRQNERQHDTEHNTFQVFTLNMKNITFDLSNGQIIPHRSNAKFIFIGMIIVAAVISCYFVTKIPGNYTIKT